MFPQYMSMFLLFCFLTNFFSIYAPVYIAAGSLKPSNPKLTTVLMQLLMFMLIFPLTQGVTLLPLGIEAVLNLLGWGQGAPICLALSLVQLAIVAVVYRFSLDWQGDLLQTREQTILETVTNRAP
jgi:ABC-2 type transport system permease protein